MAEHGRLGRRVAGVFGGVALLFLLYGLHQLWTVDRLFRETSALQRIFFARVEPLSDARARLYRIEAELRALRHFPPADRVRVGASATREIRESREAISAALADYGAVRADAPRPSGDAGLLDRARRRAADSMRAEEEAARRSLHRALAELDSLTTAIVAGEEPPVGSIEYVTDEVGEPLARLSALNRYYAELAEGQVAEARRRRMGLSLALLAALVAATGGAGVLLARSLARGVRGVADLSRGLAEGEPAPRPAPARDDELGEVAGHLLRASERMRAREAEARALADELAVREREVEQAARASAYKTWFIGHVSHEFRTPLSSIIGFTSFLAASHRTLPEGRRAEYLDIILRNARHLLHVINDILNLSKVEAGTLEVTLSPIFTTEVVTAVVTALRPQAEERRIRISFADQSRHLVVADAGRLRQVLFNLAENAIKYSPPETEVEIRVLSDPETVRIEIRDRGPGISPEDQPRLFKEFSRIQPHGAKVAGAGLGLALSKRLVELMGGRIGVESAPGEGSTFWVELPAEGEILSAALADDFPRGAADRVRTETVAVVDDDPDIRDYASAILEHAGYRVAVDDGEPGAGRRLAAAGPALVLLDLNLRSRTGFEALREIRAEPALAPVPVVAFTAASDDEAVERVREGGFHGHLLKPVEPDALLACVDSTLDAASAAPPAAEPREADYLAPLRARFRGGLPDRLRALEEARERGAAADFAREAHKLKGAAAGYGMPELSGAAAEAEEAVRGEGGGLSHPAVEALLARLREVGAASAG